jgi:hypothetical protein
MFALETARFTLMLLPLITAGATVSCQGRTVFSASRRRVKVVEPLLRLTGQYTRTRIVLKAAPSGTAVSLYYTVV